MRLLAALVLPPLLTLGIAFGAVRLVGPLTSPREHAQGVVWGKRTFVNRAALGRWLDAHGRSSQAWARRHPVKPPVATSKADRPAGRGSASFDSTMVLGGIAVLAAGGLAFLVRRRGRSPRRLSGLPRPRLGPSYARAQSATLLAWHGHPDLAWYVAGGALAVGAGLLVAGWS